MRENDNLKKTMVFLSLPNIEAMLSMEEEERCVRGLTM